MDRQEAANWIAETKKSETNWMLDQTTAYNQGIYLLYKGGHDGVYVKIDKNGEIVCGYYEGAYPHIGEAIFFPKFKKQFDNQQVAVEYVAKGLKTKNVI
jgi:hypothetical protein